MELGTKLLVRACIAILAIVACAETPAGEDIFKQGELTPYSEAVLKTFYDLHMKKVLQEGLLDGKHPIPAVNARYKELMAMTKKRYGMLPRTSLSPSFNSIGKRRVMASSGITNGVPALYIVVPLQLEYYALIKGKYSNAEEVFGNSLVISFMHELEHLAYGYVGPVGAPRDADRDELMTWSLTCEKTIRIFVDRGLPLGENDLAFYNAWVDAGRNAKSPKWADFIKSSYAPTRQKQ